MVKEKVKKENNEERTPAIVQNRGMFPSKCV
jgi:hypothetical protein